MTEFEVRVTDPTTGGMKGKKPSRLSEAPPEALLLYGEVCAMGGEKYSRHNYRRGYKWSLCYDALLRHVFASLNGEDLDPESGLPHMAHAAWHALALTQFYLDQKKGIHPAKLDDRWKGVDFKKTLEALGIKDTLATPVPPKWDGEGCCCAYHVPEGFKCPFCKGAHFQ